MSQANTALLSTAYLGPVQYFTKFLLYDTLYLEVEENYQKQSYRNRCIILSANGMLSLTVPVTKDRPKERTRDIRIDNTLEWQKNHWTSIESAYSSSPFFEFLADDFAPFYRKTYRFLLDFTLPLLEMVLGHLEIHPSVKLTQQYQKETEPPVDDLRDMIHPKRRMQKADSAFDPAFYYQVFQSRYGFVPNLSIIDLLFNEGANAENVLKQSVSGMV
jgi:hypothetical protein